MKETKRERRERKRAKKRLHRCKAEVTAVLEQSSTHELGILTKFFERKDFDSTMKVSILASALYDIQAQRRAELSAERKAARKLSRGQEFKDEPSPEMSPLK